MNTVMWSSPFTARHLTSLSELGVLLVPPVAKQLACGDTGMGAMADVRAIDDAARAAIARTSKQTMHATENGGAGLMEVSI